MESAAGEFAKGVGERPAEDGKWGGNARKMLFRRNEPKALLQIKELVFFEAKNETLFECGKPRSKPKNGHQSTLSTRRTPGATAGRPYREMSRRMDLGSKRIGMRPLRYGCAGLILACCCLLPLLAESSFAASEPIQYLLDLREPASHRSQGLHLLRNSSSRHGTTFTRFETLPGISRNLLRTVMARRSN